MVLDDGNHPIAIRALGLDQCGLCTTAYARRDGKKPPACRKAEKRYRNYGITEPEYAALLEKQDHRCGVCCQPSETALCVDHDHGTGRVRGLLCHKCNTMIGLAGDDTARLRAAIAYLIDPPLTPH